MGKRIALSLGNCSRSTFLGVQPTGRSFKTMSLDMFIIEDDKITFSYHVENWIAALQQIRGD